MEKIKNNVKSLFDYILSFSRWIALSVLVGAVCGVIGSVFHICIDEATELRAEKAFIFFFMPVGCLFIAFIYKCFASKGRIDTNLVISSLRDNNRIPLVMIPLIFISTVVTQFVGGSAGREGAALQLGGSIGYNTGKLFKLNNNNMHIIIMTGMAGVFSALFGTPITAAVFSLEVASVGLLDYTALLPCIVSSYTAFTIAGLFGISPVRFAFPSVDCSDAILVVKIVILSVMLAVLSIVFCGVIEKTHHLVKKIMPSGYVRAIVCSLILVGATLLLGTYDYNGAGMFVIERAMTGEVSPFAFILKLLFTAVSLAAGFKGGEIVPAFFVGSTFGCFMATVLGIDPVLGAAIGFVALFCGVVNCPLASIILSVEVFGTQGLLLFAISCGVSYMLSGKFSLYNSQKILYSKTNNEFDENVK